MTSNKTSKVNSSRRVNNFPATDRGFKMDSRYCMWLLQKLRDIDGVRDISLTMCAFIRASGMRMNCLLEELANERVRVLTLQMAGVEHAVLILREPYNGYGLEVHLSSTVNPVCLPL